VCGLRMAQCALLLRKSSCVPYEAQQVKGGCSKYVQQTTLQGRVRTLSFASMRDWTAPNRRRSHGSTFIWREAALRRASGLMTMLRHSRGDSDSCAQRLQTRGISSWLRQRMAQHEVT